MEEVKELKDRFSKKIEESRKRKIKNFNKSQAEDGVFGWIIVARGGSQKAKKKKNKKKLKLKTVRDEENKFEEKERVEEVDMEGVKRN